ncbi:RNA-binding cell elongation regulator Jag/EloR [Enterococcus aquimarinus]|uniref:RNA-binding protein KhpB n=1 Tax=Enterococcus aquimarinus TaxID=328396 RepID=A0A1L8QTU5_9ENTE|nr:RNA-binding cell elongation regulator Jag/EloR [Enterococcus aquimarinus]MCC9273354.1 protein jag [Enterococcus aquimarinus]OJG10938.1 RNA-binding protein [Enterococcus aquimarinus]
MPVYEGTTIEAAIQHGLKLLGVTKEQVTIKILDQGKKGFLGIGKKEAQVSLELKEVEQQTTEISQTIVEEEKPANEVSPVTRTQTLESLDNEEALKQLAIYLAEITKQMDAPATVTMSHEDHLIVFQLDTEKQGLLIGKHGKMLNAIQYLAQVFIHRVAKNKLSIVVNVGNYREKRQAILQRLAERTAEKVDRTGRPIFLEPMPAFERKQIHAALSKKDYVKTHSEGEEPYRYLVVEPAKKYY